MPQIEKPQGDPSRLPDLFANGQRQMANGDLPTANG
jgi:hypothetical protein